MADILDTRVASRSLAVRKFTHPQFAKELGKEWGVSPEELQQSCWSIYYNYSIDVDGSRVVIGSFDGKFNILRKGARSWEVLGEVA